jgi:S1-C subfamily serine protease
MLLVGALVGGAAGGVVGGSLGPRAVAPPGESGGQVTLPTATPLASLPVDAQGSGQVVDAVRELAPAVVTVVQKSGGRAAASGSGFVIDAARGYVVTNSHVVSTQSGGAGAAFDVIFSNDRTVEGRLVGRDPETDVAVLQVEASGLSLKAAPLGNSDEAPVGSTVVAIGSALGDFKNSVTAGVLSAKGRRFPDRINNIFLEDLLQTDAPISPGNSGGPLIWAAAKQVIGINTLVVREEGSEGLGFAVSSNTVRQIAEELIRSGRVERGRIGIGYQIVTSRAAQSLGLPAQASGVLVTQVQAGSPAASAGLRQNDVITKVNDQAIDEEHPLATMLLRFRAGDKVRLTVFRDGREQVVEVTLGRS